MTLDHRALLASGEQKDPQDLTIEEQWAICVDARPYHVRLATSGSVTAQRELEQLYIDIKRLEAAIVSRHRGPMPIVTVTEPLDTATLMAAVHPDCIILVESDNRQSRLEALARLLSYVERGKDLAFLLGFEAG